MESGEKAFCLRFFNTSGYVFDFSNNRFDDFTEKVVGFPIQAKYGLSKGASLEQFVHDSDDNVNLKLFSELLNYFELNCLDNEEDDERIKRFHKCKTIIEKYRSPSVEISIPSIKESPNKYILDLSKQALKCIDDGDYYSAVTKSRTMIEEALCLAIEQQGCVPLEKGDVVQLYAQFKPLYNMHSDKTMDKRINNLLSGINKIIESISEMRNKNSDSHGVGSKRIIIKKHHALLFVNSAMTITNFILAVVENKKTK
ncbi:MAG: abortive infection family protein [Treponema sp.]|nr:abortive infection family protein [Treponema sp.]